MKIETIRRPDAVVFPTRREADAWVTAAAWGQDNPDWQIGKIEKYEFGYIVPLFDPALDDA